MATTQKANLIIPEVLADAIKDKLTNNSVFAPLAEIDDTLEAKGEGDTITVTKYAYIGAAADVAEGADIGTTNLSEGKVQKTVKKIGKGVGITDEAMLSAHDDPAEEAATQLAKAIDDKTDADFLTELSGISYVRKYISTSGLTSDLIVDALEIFGEDEQGIKALTVSPSDLGSLRKDDDYIKASDIGSEQVIKGATGEIWGCQIIPTNRLKTSGDAYIIKPGALCDVVQDEVLVEPERHANTRTTDYYASRLAVPYLKREDKVVKIERRSSVKAVDVAVSTAGAVSGGTVLTVPEAPINCKWVYKLGSTDVTPTWNTAVTSYTDLVSGQEIAASTNTKASVVLVFKADDKPVDYQNVTLVKHA